MSQSIFNPDADPETTSVDGKVAVTGLNTTFSTVRGSAGSTVVDNATSIQAPILQTNGSSNYSRMDRGILLFDTSALPNNAIIQSVTLSLYVTDRLDEFTSPSGSISVVKPTPASNTALVNADFNIANWDMTKQATDLTIAGLTLNAYNDWTLNATGKGNISLTGITKLGLATSYDADNSAPGGAGVDKTAFITWDSAEGTNKPKLTVNYEVPSLSPSASLSPSSSQSPSASTSASESRSASPSASTSSSVSASLSPSFSISSSVSSSLSPSASLSSSASISSSVSASASPSPARYISKYTIFSSRNLS